MMNNKSIVNETTSRLNNHSIPGSFELGEGRTLETNIQDILHLIITPTVSAFGCLGNIISLIVLVRVRARSKMKADGTESIALLGMILLALSDMFFCIAIFPRAPVMLSDITSLFLHRGFCFYYQMYGTGVVTTFILISTWITVILSIFRYVGICHPLRARFILSKLRTRIIYGLTVLSCIIVNTPTFWQYSAKIYIMDNQTYTIMDIGILDLNTELGITYLWFRTVLGVILPALFLSVCNWLLIKALRESQRMQRRCHVHGTRTRTSTKITLTLIIIVVMFITLVFPCQIMDFLHDMVRMDHGQIERFLVVRSFANLLQVINFSCNFILYYTVGGQFREVMCETVCFCRRKKRKSFQARDVSRGSSNSSRSRPGKYFDLRTTYIDGVDSTTSYLISYRKTSTVKKNQNTSPQSSL